MVDKQDTPRITVSCTSEYPVYKPDEKSTCWVDVTLKASSYEPEELHRPALDIVAVIDKSGSMAGEKLFLVKKSLNFLVQNLLEKDRLSVITYDTDVTVEFDLLSMHTNNKEFAKGKIKKISEGSSTNLSGGLLRGLCTILGRGETKNDVASVLLFTDGLANHGITHKAKIIEAMKDPKKHLKHSDFDDIFIRQQYQCNSTPAISRNSLHAPSKGSRSSGKQAFAPRGSFFSRSLKKVANFFSTSTAQQVPTPNLSVEGEEQIEEEQQQMNEVNMEQHVLHESNLPVQHAPQASQAQVLQQPTQAIQVQQEVKDALEEPSQQIQRKEALQQAQSPLTVKEGKQDKVDTDASVYTFGFGEDHDPDMLKSISDAANGMYYFIENEEQISESFGHCFGGLVSTLGQNIQLTVELRGGVTLDALHTDHTYSNNDTRQKWEVHLGDMQSDEERDVLLTLTLPCSESSSTTNILKSSIKYFCVIDSCYKQSEAEMSVSRSADAEYSPEVANRAIDIQRNRILTTKATKEALELADQGELHLARQRLQSEIKRVEESLTKNEELCKLLIEDMQKSLRGLRDFNSYETSGRKRQMNQLQMHSKQRSNRTTEDSYSSVTRSEYMRKFK